MSIIPSLFELKGEARTLQKQLSCKLHIAHQRIASQYGFRDWAALIIAANRNNNIADIKNPISNISNKAGLPYELPIEAIEFLANEKISLNIGESVVQTYHKGLVFALDIIDSFEFRFDEIFVPCEREFYFLCADDIAPVSWSRFAQAYLIEAENQAEEPNVLLKLKNAKDINPIEFVENTLMNLSLIRFCGENLPDTFEAAYALVLERSFWHPIYMWFNGQFIDIEELPEIRINGIQVRGKIE